MRYRFVGRLVEAVEWRGGWQESPRWLRRLELDGRLTYEEGGPYLDGARVYDGDWLMNDAEEYSVVPGNLMQEPFASSGGGVF